MKHNLRISVVTLLGVMVWALPCLGQDSLVVYAGRSKSLVDRAVKAFEQKHNITVTVRYGQTTPLALALQEQGTQAQADVFWAQDAGALGVLSDAGLLATLPASILDQVSPRYRADDGDWVATSGRARTIAYSTVRVDPDSLPVSVFDLVGSQYQGKVGWAPTNASFQAFVTAMRLMHGEEVTLAWLKAMKDNRARAYPNNTAIIQAIAAGEVDYGLTNHYYLLRFKTTDRQYPVAQTFFQDGDVGNMINVAGVAQLRHAANPQAAEAFISFLLSPTAQQFFTSAIFEYPVIDGLIQNDELVSQEILHTATPKMDLDQLGDLDVTLRLLREADLL